MLEAPAKHRGVQGREYEDECDRDKDNGRYRGREREREKERNRERAIMRLRWGHRDAGSVPGPLALKWKDLR